MTNGNDWRVYQKLVLAALEDLKNAQHEQATLFNEFKTEVVTEIASLKVKAGVWGLVGGILATLPALILLFLKAFK